MSSRLFQEIRERRGLAYSVYSFASGYSDSGWFGLYAGCAPGKVDEVVALLRAEPGGAGRARRRRGGAGPRKGQVGGGLVLGLEDSGSRMTRLGRAELVHGTLHVDRRDARRRPRPSPPSRCATLAAELAARPRSLAVVGPFDADRTFDGRRAVSDGVRSGRRSSAPAAGWAGRCARRSRRPATSSSARGSTSATTSRGRGRRRRRRLLRARRRARPRAGLRPARRARRRRHDRLDAGEARRGPRRRSRRRPASACSSRPTSRSARCC